MSIVRFATLLTLVPGAVWLGIIFAYAVERTNLWSRMPLEQYVVDFRRSTYRIDPLQPFLGAVSSIGALLLALNTAGTAQALAWTGIGLMLVVFVGSTTIAEPMNSKFRRRPEGDAPPDALHLRTAWRRFHLVRTVVALAAFVAFVLAVSYA